MLARCYKIWILLILSTTANVSDECCQLMAGLNIDSFTHLHAEQISIFYFLDRLFFDIREGLHIMWWTIAFKIEMSRFSAFSQTKYDWSSSRKKVQLVVPNSLRFRFFCYFRDASAFSCASSNSCASNFSVRDMKLNKGMRWAHWNCKTTPGVVAHNHWSRRRYPWFCILVLTHLYVLRSFQ